MSESTTVTNRLSYVKLWSGICEAIAEVRAQAVAASANASRELLPLLRDRISKRLDQLSAELGRHLDEAAAQRLLLPIVLYCDELVLTKLPEPTHEAWPLLQHERFDINDGGEKFFDMIEQTLQQQQPSPLLLEVLYYLLGQGFLGRYMSRESRKLNPSDAMKIQHYKDGLAKRIQLTPPKSRTPGSYRDAERRLRQQDTDSGAGSGAPGAHMPLIAPVFLYSATFLIICALPFVLILYSNLQLQPPAPEIQPSAVDMQARADADPSVDRETLVLPAIDSPPIKPEPARSKKK